jgi:hypothetical protein
MRQAVKNMKRFTPPLITIGLSLLLAFFSAALTYSRPSDAQINFSTGAFFLQVTPTPQQEDRSEIGSTDEIIIMSGVIALIIVTPILLLRKSWR